MTPLADRRNRRHRWDALAATMSLALVAAPLALPAAASAATAPALNPIIYTGSGFPLAGPSAMASDGQHLWVAETSGYVAEIDPSDGALLRSVTAAGLTQPSGVAAQGSLVFVTSSSGNEVVAFNVTDGSAAWTAKDVADGFNGPIAVTADATHLFISNFQGNSVTELNVADGSLVQVLSGGTLGLNGPGALIEDGGNLFISNFLGNSITELNASTGTLVKVLNDDSLKLSGPDAVVGDGTHLFVASYSSNVVSEIQESSGSVVGVTAPTASLSGPAALVLQGSNLFVANRTSSAVTEFSTSGLTQQANFTGAGYGFATPSSLLATSEGVWVADTGGTALTELQTTSGPGLPGTPTQVVATPGNASVVLSWAPPGSDGGATITSYTVKSSSGATCTTKVATTAQNLRTCAIGGLKNLSAYTFTVTATNLAGTGSAASVGPVTPGTAPAAPTAVVATPGTKQATVRWSAPAANGSPITSYTVTDSREGHTCQATAPATTCTVLNLGNGLSYRFSVTATNAFGTSVASSLSAAVTPADLPAAPTEVVATSQAGAAQVSWLPSPDNGGSAIRSYTATASGATAQHCTAAVTTSEVDHCTVTGLTNGTSYTFTVVATNAIGSSAASDPSAAVVPATVPNAPTGLAVNADLNTATISWVAPVQDGGSPLLGFIATTRSGSHRCHVEDPSTTSCVIAGLTPGTSYTVDVVATNALGSSPVATITYVQPSIPGAPRAVTTSVTATSVTVTFSAPASSGGAGPLTYTVTDGVDPACTQQAAGSCTFTGLTTGTAVRFDVYASNSLGDGPHVQVSATPAAPPAAPVLSGVVAGNGRVTVSWVAPGDDGGSAITGYRVSAAGQPKFSCTAAAGATHCTVVGLVDGQSLRFSVIASNAAGASPASNLSAAVIPYGPLVLGGLPSAATGAWPASARAALALVAREIATDGLHHVVVTSYFDNSLPAAKALAASKLQANSAVAQLTRALSALHVSGVHPSIVAKGSAAPIASNATSVGRAKNRRVLLQLS